MMKNISLKRRMWRNVWKTM